MEELLKFSEKQLEEYAKLELNELYDYYMIDANPKFNIKFRKFITVFMKECFELENVKHEYLSEYGLYLCKVSYAITQYKSYI
jgi:hypothetical protein